MASEEAARQEDVLGRLAAKALHSLWKLRNDVTVFIEHLSLLVGDDSFYSVLSTPGDGCPPPRNLAVLFGTSPRFLELSMLLHSTLATLFDGHGASKVSRDEAACKEQGEEMGNEWSQATAANVEFDVMFNMEAVLPCVMKLLVRMGRECMAPLASNALRCIAELKWMRSDADIAARIDCHEQVCGRSIEDLLCAPLCYWPPHVEAVQILVQEMQACLDSLSPTSKSGEWLRQALEQRGLDELHQTAALCMEASQDVGGYLHTLAEVDRVPPALVYGDGSSPEMWSDQVIHRPTGMQRVAPIPGHVYTHAAAGAHHRVLLSIQGELLPSFARVNDVCAGLAAGRPCSVMILNDVLVVTHGLEESRGDQNSSIHRDIACLAAAGGSLNNVARSGRDSGDAASPADHSTAIFYLPETLIVRIR